MVACGERIIGRLQVRLERLFLAIAAAQDRFEIHFRELEELDLVSGALGSAPVCVRERLAESDPLRVTNDDCDDCHDGCLVVEGFNLASYDEFQTNSALRWRKAASGGAQKGGRTHWDPRSAAIAL
jgi:hypothetical protein